MRAAKIVICVIMTIALSLFPARGKAYAAAARYARADSREVYLCSQKTAESALFAVPYTYCVEILSSDGEWYYVRYAEDNGIYRAVYGYCLISQLTVVDEPPENIYLYMPVTVTYKTDTPAGSLPVLGELNVTAAFYGTYYSGPTAYSYVLYEESYGYIYGANDDYPLNELPSVAEETPEKKSDTKLIVALALTAFAVAALIIIYLTGRKRSYNQD